MKLINVGHGNLVAAERIVAILSPESQPIKRLVQDAKEEGRAIDVTCGHKTRTVLQTDTGHIVLCDMQTETIAARLSEENEAAGASSAGIAEESTDARSTAGRRRKKTENTVK